MRSDEFPNIDKLVMQEINRGSLLNKYVHQEINRVLDKIRAEIMSKDGLEEALEIIDKYKKESEE